MFQRKIKVIDRYWNAGKDRKADQKERDLMKWVETKRRLMSQYGVDPFEGLLDPVTPEPEQQFRTEPPQRKTTTSKPRTRKPPEPKERKPKDVRWYFLQYLKDKPLARTTNVTFPDQSKAISQESFGVSVYQDERKGLDNGHVHYNDPSGSSAGGHFDPRMLPRNKPLQRKTVTFMIQG